MSEKFDCTLEYGIVLEGGGAKGAYQIGVWKALLEHGIKIKGVAGVSVGALNGAFICMQEYERAVALWENIAFSQVMDVNDENMESLISGNLLSLNLGEVAKLGSKVLLDRGFDVTPLKEMIEREVDEKKIKESPIEFELGTFSMSDLKEVQLNAKTLEEGELKDYLLASAYFPGFKKEPLGGKIYMDGGITNNIPVDLLVNKGYKNIIVIRIFGIGIEKRVEIPEGVNIIEIAPRVNLGRILEFNHNKSKRNILIGYYDGLRCIRSLKGKIYYIDTKERTETCYLNFFSELEEAVQMDFIEYFKLDYDNSSINLRKIMEQVLPNIAVKLKLDKDWTYEELYLSMLELCAKFLRIPKYAVYTIEELAYFVRYKYEKRFQNRKIVDLFVEMIIKMFCISEIPVHIQNELIEKDKMT